MVWILLWYDLNSFLCGLWRQRSVACLYLPVSADPALHSGFCSALPYIGTDLRVACGRIWDSGHQAIADGDRDRFLAGAGRMSCGGVCQLCNCYENVKKILSRDC